MPYIITTCTPDTHEPTEDGQLGNVALGNVTRTAVATLDEARDLAAAALPDPATYEQGIQQDTQITDLPESGGTVGPLPDGTVIEVAPATVVQLAARLDSSVPVRRSGSWTTDVIAAFNERN